jgi:hypothetical protein
VLHVDCTALGLNNAPATPIFAPSRIVLQQVRYLSPTFNAALVGFVEAHRDDDADKNQLCVPHPNPSSIEDWPRMMRCTWMAGGRWLSEPELSAWVANSRLTCCAHFPTTRPSPRCRRRSRATSRTSRQRPSGSAAGLIELTPTREPRHLSPRVPETTVIAGDRSAYARS